MTAPEAVTPAVPWDGQEKPARRILLVDDRVDNLVALTAVLQPLGYELLTASSGAEALRTLLAEEVAAIVLDVQMPDMDGFETAALLKQRAATRSIPILFLTAVGRSVEHELRGYEVGGVDYIYKPFEPRVLQAKVRAVVELSADLRAVAVASKTYEEAELALASLPESNRAGDDPASQLVVTKRMLEISLEPKLTSPALARAAVREALAGRDDDLIDVVVLLVSELVANAVLHARSTARIALDLGEEVVRVGVGDSGPSIPELTISDVPDESGRGLGLVQQLATRCGWNQLQSGKFVWFEIDIDPPGTSR